MADATRTVVVEAKTKGVDKATEEVTDLSGGVTDLTDNIQVLGVSVGDIRGKLSNFTGGIKKLTTSFKVLGAVSIVGIIAGLAAAFAKTQKGADLLSDAMNGLNGIINGVVQNFNKLGEIGTNILNVLKAPFTGESVTEQWEELKDSVSDFGTAVVEATKAQVDLGKRQRELEVNQARAERQLRDNVRLLERQKEIRDDERRTFQERIEANRTINEINEESRRIAEGINKEALDYANLLVETTKGTDQARDAQIEYEDILRENSDRIEEISGRTQEYIANQNALNTELKELSSIAPITTEINEGLETTVKLRQKDVDLLKQQNDNIKKNAQAELDGFDAFAAKRKEFAQEEQDIIIGLFQLNQKAGQAALTVAQTLTVAEQLKALVSSLASPGTLFTKLASFIAIAGQVANIVRQSKQLVIPDAGLSRQFALGTVLQGPSHADGGIHVYGRGGYFGEAEGGEAIINKRSTRMFKPLLSAINQMGGGRKFQFGAVLPSAFGASDVQRLIRQTTRNEVQVPVLVVEDLKTTEDRVQIRENRGSFPGN